MFLASHIIEDAETIFGFKRGEKLFLWITDAVELLAQKGEIDPLVGFVDLCVDGGCVTPKPEVSRPQSLACGAWPGDPAWPGMPASSCRWCRRTSSRSAPCPR